MADAAAKLLTVDEWLAWTQANPDTRTELFDGVIVPMGGGPTLGMAPELRQHARLKFLVARELDRAIGEAGLPCTVYVDGLGVAVGEASCFIPDVLVECGPEIDEGRLSETPTIVVEALSPSNNPREMTRKLLGYFRLASVAHYLVIDPVARSIDHHFRSNAGAIEIRTVETGVLILDPPGLALDIDRTFARRAPE